MASPGDDKDIEQLFYDGCDLHGERRYDEAMACFEACLELDPDYRDALLGKAMVYMERGEMDDAINVALRLVELDPDDILAQTNLSMFYQRAGRIEEAEAAGAAAKMLDWKRQLSGEDD